MQTIKIVCEHCGNIMSGVIGDGMDKKYFITTDNYKSKLVGIEGPFQSLDEAISINGRTTEHIIVEQNIVEGTKPVYRWTGERWRKI